MSLRVGMLAGSLGQGGAEKQLVYMVRALLDANVEVQVYCLTRGDWYEQALNDLGVSPVFVGEIHNPLGRILELRRAVRQFRPHVLQAVHFYTNLYATIVGKSVGCLAFGSIRNDTHHELNSNGRWGPWLLHRPPEIIANSKTAVRNACRRGVSSDRLHYLPNVLDLIAFDRARHEEATELTRRPCVAAVSRLVPQKRLGRFLETLSLARRSVPELTGIIVGEGPERDALLTRAEQLGLLPDGVRFAGASRDIPNVLSQVDVLVLTSDNEGFPNVVLEAMAARRPVITTPAGDAGEIVEDGVSGFVVDFDNTPAMSEYLVRLVESPSLRRDFGERGRRKVESRYDFDGLSSRLLAIYQKAAEKQRATHVLSAIPV